MQTLAQLKNKQQKQEQLEAAQQQESLNETYRQAMERINNGPGSDAVETPTTIETTSTNTASSVEIPLNTTISSAEARTAFEQAQTFRENMNTMHYTNRQTRSLFENGSPSNTTATNTIPEQINTIRREAMQEQANLNHLAEGLENIQGHQQAQQQAFLNLANRYQTFAEASQRLINDYVTFITLHPYQSLLTGAAIVTVSMIAIRRGFFGRLLGVFRGPTNIARHVATHLVEQVPAVAPTNVLTVILPTTTAEVMRAAGEGGGALYLIRNLFRFLRHTR